VEASADKHEKRDGSVTVSPGQTATVNWTLKPVKVEPPPPPTPRLTKDFFTNGEQWTPEEDGWYSFRGDGYSWFKSSRGTHRIEIQKGKRRALLGRKKIAWVVAYRDERNYVLYEIGGGELTRRRMIDGKWTRGEESFRHLMDREEYFSLSITIEPKRIVHRNQDGATIDDFPSDPDEDLTQGRFGFKGEATVRIL
jgi:hypothetical protein